MKTINYLLSLILLLPIVAIAQESSAEHVEEVVVVGSQLKCASITGALPVPVISADAIDILGVDDCTALVETLTDQGMTYCTEA